MKVLIADAHPLSRTALGAVIVEARPDAQLSEAGDLNGTLRLLNADTTIDVVFIDPALPDAHDLLALETIRWSHAGTPVVVVSDRDDALFQQSVAHGGAHAFVSKRWPLHRFRATVGLALVGGAFAPIEALYVPAAEARFRRLEPATPGADALRRLRLTPRQREVLAMLAQGWPNKVICRRLGLAENTVKAHTSAIYRVLGVANRTQALAALVRLGITADTLTASQAPRGGESGDEEPFEALA